MKKYVFLLVFFIGIKSFAQEIQQLTLDETYALARKNYPAIQRQALIKKTTAIQLDNLQKGFLPQIQLNAQATYQSDVTKIPVMIPGFDIENPSKDQYKIVADLSQMIYDGGQIKARKEMQQLSASVDQQNVEVELYQLKDRINQIFLSILYLDAQARQINLVEADLQTGIKKVQAQVDNGVAFRSNLNLLKAELLTTAQRGIDIESSRKGLINVLAVFLGKDISQNVVLLQPAVNILEKQITRPELKLFDEQKKMINQQNELIDKKNLPTASVFLQGGYGRPALNLLKNDFDFYYIGGLRVNWALSRLYTRKKEKEQVEINKKMLDLQEETFLLNTNTELKKQAAIIDKLKDLIVSDQEIIALRKSVTDAAKAQLDNGVITANDFVKEVNAEDQARQNLLTHQIQLLQAKINYNTLAGK